MCINIKVLFLVLFFLYCGGCKSKDQSISLISLISNGEKYNNETVIVHGFVNFGFENNAVFYVKEHFEYNVFDNAIWLYVDDESELKIYDKNNNIRRAPSIGKDELSGKYVLIKGVYSSSDSGHMGLYSGSIKVLYMSLREQ